MKLVWSEPSEKAKSSPGVSLCMSIRWIINCGLAESLHLSKHREINLDNYTEAQAMALIDLLDRNGCAPELV